MRSIRNLPLLYFYGNNLRVYKKVFGSAKTLFQHLLFTILKEIFLPIIIEIHSLSIHVIKADR